MICLEPVGAANEKAVRALHTAPGQEGFVEPVAQCLEEARQLAYWRPVAIRRGGEVVGFAMYGFFPEEGRHGRLWLDRLLIGAEYQGQGLGKQALANLLRLLWRQHPGADAIYLSVVEHNPVASRLYSQAGFRLTGERDVHGEWVMRLDKELWHMAKGRPSV